MNFVMYKLIIFHILGSDQKEIWNKLLLKVLTVYHNLSVYKNKLKMTYVLSVIYNIIPWKLIFGNSVNIIS